MKKNKKRNRIMLLLVLLLAVTIGFAALSTTLKINGTANISKNSWNIYWDNVANEQGVTATTPVIGDDENEGINTVVTWDVTLDKPGDFYEFTVDAVNAGTLDAMITDIESKLNGDIIDSTNKLPSYIKYTVKYADGKPILKNHLFPKAVDENTPTVEPIKVRIEYSRDVTNEEVNNQVGTLSYTLSFAIKYEQATDKAIPRPKTLQEDDWPTIISNVKADISSYDVGETKTIEIDIDGDSTPETYTLRVANNTTPAECSGQGFSQTACGFVFEFEDIIDFHMMNLASQDSNITNGHFNKGGWKYSDMRAYLNNGIYLEGTAEEVDYTTTGLFNKLPSVIKDAIIDTEVVSGYGNRDTTNFTTEDKIYLLSAREVWEDTSGDPHRGISVLDKAYNNSRQLDYYKARGVTTTNTIEAIKTLRTGEGPYDWWLRTPGDDFNAFLAVIYNGNYYSHNSFYDTVGVSPAFRVAE